MCSSDLERAQAAFIEELHAAPWAERVTLHFDVDGAAAALQPQALLRAAPAGSHVYVCGPNGFMDWVLAEAEVAGLPADRRHREYFSAPASSVPPGAVAVVACSPAGDADRAIYARYPDPASLDAAFEAHLASAGSVPVGGECDSGPAEGTWSAGSGAPGRFACHADPSDLGRRIVAWTAPASRILALGVRSTGGWPELYDWWLGAGPG